MYLTQGLCTQFNLGSSMNQARFVPSITDMSVTDCMALCGIPNDPVAGGGPTLAERIAADLFMDDYERAFSMSAEDLKDDLKTLSQLTNPIIVSPSTRTKILGFIEWTKQCLRCLQQPEDYVYPATFAMTLVSESKDQAAFLSRSKLIATIAKPQPFKSTSSWQDFSAQMQSFLSQMPGRFGHPLAYVIRDNEQSVFDHEDWDINIHNRYIAAAATNGSTFELDSLEVHSYIVSFVAGNTKAETAIHNQRARQCGREDWKALKQVYEGNGAFKIEVVDAEHTLETMFYSGEKDGRLKWEKFESRLVTAFHDKNKNSRPGTVMYDDVEKIKKLLKMTRPCAQLKDLALSIQRDLGRANFGNLTFDQVLDDMRNVVVTEMKRHQSGNPRNIQNTNSDRNGPNPGRAGRGGRNGGHGGRNHGGYGRGGSGGRGGRGNNSGTGRTRNHPDQYRITLTNGKHIDAHPSYTFTADEFNNMHPQDKQNILDKRAEYKARGGNPARNVNQLTFNLPNNTDAATIASAITMQLSQAHSLPAAPSGATIHGGRTEEANRRGQNRQASHYYSVRHMRAATRETQAARHVPPPPHVRAANECDSNADTCCAGTNFVVLQHTSRSADVYPYDSSYQPITNVPIVSAATAWTNPETNETIILVFHETLYYGTSLAHTLWNPNQLRHNGVEVNDNPYDTSNRRLTICVEDLVIPLHSHGTKVQFHTQSPTEAQLQFCRHVEMTNLNPWNPSEVTLGAVDSHASSDVFSDRPRWLDPRIRSNPEYCSDALLHDLDPALVGLKELAISHVRISSASL